jgi:alpha-1,6-mannosyltransferase
MADKRGAMSARDARLALLWHDLVGHPVGNGTSLVLAIGSGSGLLYVGTAAAQRALQHGPGSDGGGGLAFQVALYVMATIGLFVLYGRLLVVCGSGGLQSRGARMLAIGFPVLFNGLWLLVPPALSIDLLSYVSHGHLWSVQDANPYVVPSSAVAHTAIGPELTSYGWRPVHPLSPYGPAWTYLEGGVAALFHGVKTQMVVLKLIVVMGSLGSAALIWLILGWVRPEYRLLGTLAYLWNPVIMAELAGEGHNDAVMVFLVLVALALTVRRRAVSGIAAMSLGVLTKYLPLLLVPLQAVYLWRTSGDTRKSTAQAVMGAAVALVLAALLFTPLWVGMDTFDGIWMSGQGGNTGSTQTVVTGLLSLVIPPDVAKPLLLLLAVAGFVAYLGAQAASVTDARSLLLACASVSTAYLLLVSPTYWPWYAVLPVALLALTPQGLSVQLLVAVSLGSRLAAPLDMVFVHQLVDRRMYLLLTWCAGVGLPLLLLALTLARRLRASSSLPQKR